MKREEGYYWVRNDIEWFIAEWDTYYWHIAGSGSRYKDEYFDEIDERRVVREVLGSTITYTPCTCYDGKKLNGMQMDEEGQTLHQTAYKRTSYDMRYEEVPTGLLKCRCGGNKLPTEDGLVCDVCG